MASEEKNGNYIKFLGTAGARFVVIKQLRSSGGFILNFDGYRIHVDPGPGAIVKLNSSKPRLDPYHTDCVLISHRHLDHTNDVNVVIEGMTNGGLNKRGLLITPQDCLDNDPVVLRYVRNYLEKIIVVKEKEEIDLGPVKIIPVFKLQHGVENYAFLFQWKNGKILFISDTEFFEMPLKKKMADVLIVNTVLTERRQGVLHLCIDDAMKIIERVHPELAILTHFGMHIVQSKPWEIAEKLSRESGLKIIAANDGMRIDL
jgi:phosphoribosyl 1,2-cyclic phosphodiesterase